MKKFLNPWLMAMMAVMVLSMAFTACSSDDDTDDNAGTGNLAKTIVGTWKQDGDKDVVRINADGTLAWVGKMSKDGRFIEDDEDKWWKGTWTLDGELLTMVDDDGIWYCRVLKASADQIVWRDYHDGDAYLESSNNPGAEYIYQDKYGVYRLWTWTRIGD